MSDKIVKVAIYPPLGVARVGNSDEYYIASDVPGQAAVPEDGYKDKKGRVKKQAVRFRVYGLNDQNEVVSELSAKNGATIGWRAHIANRKAGWYQFNNALDLPGLALPSAFRNDAVTAGREKLIIDPGARSITGINTQGEAYRFTGGKFYNIEVPLGEIRTDEQGRLIVLGGDGHSASYDGAQAVTFANNDGWHDDVSDGTIRATVTYNGQTFEAEPAMVAVTPPNFGQGLFGVVTMLDVVEDLYYRSQWLEKPKAITFWKHIYPILERTVQTQWVNGGFYILFGQNSPSDFTSNEMLAQLKDPSAASQALRKKVADWYRQPDGEAYEPAKIPPFYGDAFGDYEDLPNVCLPLTHTQFEWMQQWANGDFTTGTQPTGPVDFDKLSAQEQTEAMNRAPLEECLGGPFHPGIELTWPLRNLIIWDKPFRLKILAENEMPKDDYGPMLAPQMALGNGGPLDGSGPGSLTRWLGVPWQTDEASCLSGYDPSTYLTLPSFWAARVPNYILSADSYKRLSDASVVMPQRLKHLDYRQDWMRDLGNQYVTRINNMVKKWHELGIICEHPLPEKSQHEWLPTQLWVESDRGPFIEKDPTFEQVKIAENASEPMVKAAKTVLKSVAGIEETAQRPVRDRPLFRRNER